MGRHLRHSTHSLHSESLFVRFAGCSSPNFESRQICLTSSLTIAISAASRIAWRYAPSNASTLTRSAPISIPTCASIAAPASRRARFMPSTKPSICLMISVVGSRSTPIARMPCPWSTQSRIRFPPPSHVAPSLATECGEPATTAAVCHVAANRHATIGVFRSRLAYSPWRP